ncbi:sensor histidine kinase [Algoriphagus marinus]|uniref:sensor histidine kinase n=1 Tax=Algoriphagus marinus TaxID=1925762 RepID=UPI00094B7B41|nr:ATP-binding protein [Algoriphagus marinus]
MKSAAQLTAENRRLQQSVKEQALELDSKNRELEIEAALERVRARAMAMKKSEELIDTASLLYRELSSLGIEPYSTGFVLVDELNEKQEVWFSAPGGKNYMNKFFLPLTGDPVLNERYHNWKNKEPIYHEKVGGKKLIKHLQFVSQFFGTREAEEQAQVFPQIVFFYCGYFPQGYLHILTETLLDAEQESIMKRFTKAFSMTYTRFLDLQKAEAQAREAQIEAALERVRSRSLAMHESKEINEVLAKTFEEFTSLGVRLARAIIWIYQTENRSVTLWFANPESESGPESFHIHDNDNKVYNDYWKLWNERQSKYYYELVGDAKKSWDDHLFSNTGLANLPKEVQLAMREPDPIHLYNSFQDFGVLFVASTELLNDADFLIVERFAKVFQQAWTRFTDIQKAEAQAREAQIEAALERIRSRSMGMQSSEELREVVQEMYNQVEKLGIATWGCFLFIFNKEKDNIQGWFSEIVNSKYSKPFYFDNKDHEVVRKWWQFWESDEEFMSIHQKDEVKHEFARYLFTITGMRDLPEVVKTMIMNEPQVYFEYVNMTHGIIQFVDINPFPANSIPVLKRITSAFEQAYTRFLDIQKAEAQAREGEIELALERVRSRTMAMHQSEELSEVAALLFDQLKILGAQLWTAGFAICKKDEVLVEKWMSSPIPGQMFNHLFVPYNADHGEQRMYDTWKNQEALHSYTQGGKELKDIYDHLMEIPSFKANFQKVIDFGRPLPIWQKNHVAAYKYGYLLIITEEEFEEEYIFPRFAKVFEQTYTRFLDLEKAEAQAREAEIQLALERVRARTMAMQKSDELSEVASIMFQKIQELGNKQWTSGFEIWEPDQISSTAWVALPDGSLADPMTIPFNEDPFFKTILEARQNGETFLVFESSGKSLEDTYKYMSSFSSPKKFFEESENLGFEIPTFQITHCVFFSFGFLIFITYEPVPEMWGIFKRFAKVFEQTYTRFLDLQRAEAQAREAEIEAALERVRAKTMGMHSSNELLEIVDLLYTELSHLDVALARVVLLTIQKDSLGMKWWIASPEKEIKTHGFLVPANDLPMTLSMVEAWKNKRVAWSYHLKGKDKKAYDKFLFTKSELAQLPEEVQMGMSSAKQMHVSGYCNNFGILTTSTLEPLSDSNSNLLARFGMVFEQTYTRFLDLQKAEAQAREAEIQLALERVRARTMAMQKSEELSEAGNVLFQQLHAIGIVAEGSWITLIDPEEDSMTMWVTHHNLSKTPKKVFGDDHPNFRAEIDAWKSKQESIKIQMPYDDFVKSSKEIFGIEVVGAPEKPIVYIQHILHGFGFLGASTYEEISEKDLAIYRRFTKVFEQTYTRFLDLKKAEAQSRESQIQLALERVRARTMAMHKSDELIELNAVILQQVRDLGVEIFAAGIHITDPNKPISETWIGDPVDGQMPRTVIDHSEDQLLVKMYQGWKSGEKFIIELIEGDKLKNHFQNMAKMIPEQKMFEVLLPPDKLYFHMAYFYYGFFAFATEKPSPENHDIFTRFAKVFEQTYTRFLDLQKAEAQAREAQIEAALERVRSSAMAMQKSSHLKEVVRVMIENLNALDVETRLCEILLFGNNFDSWKSWIYVGSGKDLLDFEFSGPYFNHPFNEHHKNAFQKGMKYTSYVLEGEDKTSFDKLFDKHMTGSNLNQLKELVFPIKRTVFSLAFLSQGAVLVGSDQPLSKEGSSILERFAKVVDFTYTRVEDLQKAEKRTLEAIKQSSLDRVRAEIASMRNTEDLQRITPLIWRELLTLGVPFFRCGLMIVDEKEEKVRFYLSTPDGKPLAALNLDFESNDISTNGVKYWRKQEPYVAHWNQEEFLAFSKTLLAEHQIQNVKTYQGGEAPPESLTLQFIPFPQGMLYVGSKEDLSPAQIELVQNLADAFSVAYARYEDFKQLEDAKSQIEQTLSELKSTQAQLIQSEKMASLGELTAGIAHEIQNPLNFVNNFSEVSTELVDEMKEELAAGSVQFAVEIADDLKQNLEKITLHGKRADAIVKGMLEHSKRGSGQKELTNLNALADEFLRLSYQAFLAKQPDFKCELKTNLDPNLPKVSVIPQDIGKVLLNLINNAFYAVHEKAKSENVALDYTPMINVSTCQIPPEGGKGGYIEVSVQDNGPGIPNSIKEKIFQPFFTTKPTGAGTGLGLSLSYDIVKAHGGTLQVNSSENGSIFTIKLQNT